MATTKHYLAGLLTGLATGLTIGFLTAPRSGKETREKIADTAEEQTKGLKNQWDKTVSQAKESFENIKSQAGTIVDKTAGKVGEYKDTVVDAYEKERSRMAYNGKVEDVADAVKSGVDKAEDALKKN